MEFRILGPLTVCDEGRELPLRAAKPRTLLALLLLHGNQPVTSERLIDWLWDGSPPATARTSLQIYVSELRKLLGDGRLETRPGGYVLHVRPDELDLAQVEQLLEQARSADPQTASTLLQHALTRFTGDPLPELRYHRDLGSEVARLEELRLHVLELRIAAQLELDAHADLVPELEALTAAHPLREGFRSQQMLALYRCARQADALAAFQSLRHRLDAELGLEPTPAVRDLQRRILNHDPALAAPAEASTGAARRRRRGTIGLVCATLAGLAVALLTMQLDHPGAARTATAGVTRSLLAISQTTIDGVTLGRPADYYKTRLGPYRAQELTEVRFPSLAFEIPEVAVYFPRGGRRAHIITTWNRSFRTAAGIGPCSTIAAMKKAYGHEVTATWAGGDPPHAYAVGKNLLFETDDLETIAAVALYRGDPRHTRFDSPQAYAAYVAAVETPCR